MNEFFSNLFGSPIAGLIGAIGQGALTEDAIRDIGQARQEANIFFGGQPDLPTYEGGLIGEVQRQSQFKPFTVTSPTGATAAFTSEGMQVICPRKRWRKNRCLWWNA